MKTKIDAAQALGSYVIIELETKPTQSTAGLFIPTNTQDKSTVGKIISVGKGEFKEGAYVNLDPSLEIGAIVLFKQYSGTEIEINGIACVVINAKDVMAVIKTNTSANAKN